MIIGCSCDEWPDSLSGTMLDIFSRNISCDLQSESWSEVGLSIGARIRYQTRAWNQSCRWLSSCLIFSKSHYIRREGWRILFVSRKSLPRIPFLLCLCSWHFHFLFPSIRESSGLCGRTLTHCVWRKQRFNRSLRRGLSSSASNVAS